MFSGSAEDRAADGQWSQWCNYFVHTGHLHIAGRKMSKSLKNFISIESFLGDGNTADEFRMFCLLHRYNSTVHYSADRMKVLYQLY
jgi:cysteinyl-tRNA synthetase